MNWKNEFKNPPRKYAIYPMLHGGISNPENNLKKHLQQGWGGMVVNLRYNREFPKDTKEWKAMEAGVRAYAEQGFKLWIYDENGYPSGSAGGAVLDAHPEFEALGIVCYCYWKELGNCKGYRADTPEGNLFGAYLVRLDKEQEAIDITNTANQNGTLYFDVPEGSYRLVVLVERRLFDATHAAHSYSEPRRYIDLFNPNATKAFLDCTYENYSEYVGDLFGETIPAFFTDEPSLIGWPIPNTSYPMVSWSHLFADEFYKKFGYPVQNALLAVFTHTGPDRIKRCCDFWDMTSHLISQNFFKILEDWCSRHKTSLSGHLLNEEQLVDHIYNYGSLYRSLKQMGQPGIDLLNSDPNDLMARDSLPIARLAGSVSDVFDRPETMSESCELVQNMRGQKLPLDWLKATCNWHFALGVNNITSYYKMQAFSDEEITELNRSFARTGSLIRKGRRNNRVAVLYPEYSMYSHFKPTEKARNGGQNEDMMKLNNSLIKTSWELLNRQIDFDYLDEEELQKTTLIGNKLCHTVQRYEVIILPCVSVLCDETYELLDRFITARGRVIALDQLPTLSRESGKETFLADSFKSYHKNGKLPIAKTENFAEIAEYLPRSIRLIPSDNVPYIETVGDEKLSSKILSHLRKDGEDTILYLCNMGDSDYNGTLILPTCKTVFLADPETGSISEMTLSTKNENSCVSIRIPAFKGVFVIAK